MNLAQVLKNLDAHNTKEKYFPVFGWIFCKLFLWWWYTASYFCIERYMWHVHWQTRFESLLIDLGLELQEGLCWDFYVWLYSNILRKVRISFLTHITSFYRQISTVNLRYSMRSWEIKPSPLLWREKTRIQSIIRYLLYYTGAVDIKMLPLLNYIGIKRIHK